MSIRRADLRVDVFCASDTCIRRICHAMHDVHLAARMAEAFLNKKRKRKCMLEQIVEPLLGWFGEHARILPWREQPQPYRVWVSEIMLQQTV